MTRYDSVEDLPDDLRDLSADDRLDQSTVGRVAEMYDDPTDVFVYLLGWVLLWGLTPAYVAFGILEYGPLVATAITVGIFVVAGFAIVPLAEWAHELRGRRRIEQHSSSIYTTESTEGSN